MDEQSNSSRLIPIQLLAVLLPVIIGPTAWAEPLSLRERLAAQPASSIAGIRELQEQAAGRAADLQYRPSLWSWTQPVTVPRLAQAAPAPPAVVAQTEDSADILDEVSVTATRRAVRQRDTTATTYTVKKEDFRALGATTVSDGLQLVPGFQAPPSLGGVRNIGNTFLRGFNDQRFTVLKDGLPTTRSSNGRSDFAGFQADDLERIEVVTGGATLRYGSGSVGGVINLISETPRGLPKLTLEYQSGSYGFSKYTAKYGGGDDTFSYNFVYSGIVSFNNYPFNYTIPNSAQYYGPTSNRNAALPPVTALGGNTYPNTGTRGRNSYNLNGPGTNDPANTGAIDLYGFLKPEVGPPVTVSGTASGAANASDVYSAKLVFKPDPFNRVSFRFGQQNRSYYTSSPGIFSSPVCIGRTSQAANPVLTGQRVLPVDVNGNPLPCDVQRYNINTASIFQAQGIGIYPISASLDGSEIFPTGNPYQGGVEAAKELNVAGVQRQDIGQFDTAVLWDYDLSPTTSINSYVYFLRLYNTQFNQALFPYDTNIQRAFGTGTIPGVPGLRLPPTPAQQFIDNTKIEIQTSLNTKLSPGQDLSFGLNFLEDRSYQQQIVQTGINPTFPFFDKAIARYSFFLIDDISFSEQFKANLGLRYTSSSQFGELLTPAAGIRFTPNSVISLRANFSQVFNAPNLTAIYLSGGANLINEQLKPETGVTYDLGFDFTPARNVGIRFTYFNTYLDGVFGAFSFSNPNPAFALQFPLVNQNVNLDSRLASGLEFTGDWQISEQFRFRATWTNTDARPYGRLDDPSQNTFPYFYGYQDPQIPFNSVVLSASYANRGALVSLVGRYDSGKRRLRSLDSVPAWFTLDLNAIVPLTESMALTGSVYNLLDSRYEFLDGQPAPGITFRVGARMELGMGGGEVGR